MTEYKYRFVVDIYAETDDPQATGWTIMEQIDGELDDLGDTLTGEDAYYIRVRSRPAGFIASGGDDE